MKIAHVINIFTPDYQSDLYLAQPITLESMRVSRDFASGEVDVMLYSAHYKEDDASVPDYFNKTHWLEKSVLDVAKFEKHKKLPLINDILSSLYNASDADYFIYTNNDIILQPSFYVSVKQIIEKGFDAFIINRRRIHSGFSKVEDLPLIYAEKGKKHPGFDCFVFKRDIFPKMQLGNICIGVPFIGVTLAHNLFCFARQFKLFDNLHLTAHIGMDIMGLRDEYYWHNRGEFNKIIKSLKPYIDIRKFPYADHSFFKRYIKWGLNPSLFVFMNMKLELAGFGKRIKKGFNRFF